MRFIRPAKQANRAQIVVLNKQIKRAPLTKKRHTVCYVRH